MKPRSKTRKTKHPVNTRHATTAFTLIEVIVALAILGTGITAVFGVLSVCSRAAHHNRMLTQAVLLAESELARASLVKRTEFGTQDGTSGPFKWQVDIASTPVEDLAAIKVTVTWSEQKRPQSYELLSCIRMKSFVEKET